MIIVRLLGGLGNQMFQYAAARRLADKHGVVLKLDLTCLLDRTPQPNVVFRDYDLDLFPIRAEFASNADLCRVDWRRVLQRRYLGRLLGRLTGKDIRVVQEQGMGFNPSVLDLPDDVYLSGYWQSEQYFADIADRIRDEFLLEPLLAEASLPLARDISSRPSVCVNVRRTDYLNTDFHGVCGMDYYNTGAEWIAGRVADPYFYVFSDDIEWAAAEFPKHFRYRFEIVGQEHAGRKYGGKLALMGMCRHFIAANSSFVWWAAWLSRNSDKIVIAPRCWFADEKANRETDIVPSGWIRI